MTDRRLFALAVALAALLAFALVVAFTAETPPPAPPSSSTTLGAAPIELERRIPLQPSRGAPRTTMPTPATTASTRTTSTRPAPPPLPVSAPSSTVAKPEQAQPSGPNWPALRWCENRRQCQLGDCYRSDPGDRYRGAYQFSYATWRSVGGAGDPAAAPPTEQDRRAELLLDTAGAGQWPVCGRALSRP